MRVLLTGAAGFIAGHVSTALHDAGHEVVGLDVMLPVAHGVDAPTPAGIERVDVRDADALTAVLAGVDVVCHQAAMVGAGVDAADAPLFAGHNDLGTAVLLAAMAEARVRRLVLASSMVVYGSGRYTCPTHGTVEPAPRTTADLDAGVFDSTCPHCERRVEWALVDEDAPLRPRSTYAASKLAQEHYALAWTLATGGSVTALRYHNVYGEHMPRDTPYSGVAAIFRSSLEAGQAPRVFEDGGQVRDFVHVRDVARVNRLAVEAALGGFTPLNVCSGVPVTIGAVAATLARAHGGAEPVVTGQYRSGDVRHVVADPARAASVLGFRASVGPEEGITAFADAPLRAVPARA
ncbi:NAD-dependent epimerase/dehydratase family protein [Rhodococcus antarcticus]|uniref:NAD-dependent epimerase/dehydratase family protein n=1 Tax=Rhodococcus antarcticus TaxID=2987751 RepID=A0ABY6NZI6_9NOCA|nr:NAD-dependent epimerase/dehydratase family protein [Rhodococcus antarcticus]UZJ24812.1 NAD-dependent epimerase/dehydratase family protein [Rhodococcus antarcticus]